MLSFLLPTKGTFSKKAPQKCPKKCPSKNFSMKKPLYRAVFYGGAEGSRTPVRRPSWQIFYRLSEKYESSLQAHLFRWWPSGSLADPLPPSRLQVEQFPAIIDAASGRAGRARLGEPLKQQLIRSYYLRLILIPTFLAQFWALRPAYLPKTIPVETITAPGNRFFFIICLLHSFRNS